MKKDIYYYLILSMAVTLLDAVNYSVSEICPISR